MSLTWNSLVISTITATPIGNQPYKRANRRIGVEESLGEEMIERVTQAISNATGWTEEGSFDTCCTEPVDAARAAIAAMREPTKKMIDAATAAYIKKAGSLDYDEVWRAMIDAALKEPA